MTDKKDIPRWPFPDIVWETFTESKLREIRDEEIDGDELESLIELMWTEPECAYYLFWPTNRPLGKTLVDAIEENRLLRGAIESRWYIRPNVDHFIKIEKPQFDWHRETVKTTMFYRAELRLSVSETRRLDGAAQRKTIQEAMTAASPSYGLSIVNRAVQHFRKHQHVYGLAGTLVAIVGLLLALL